MIIDGQKRFLATCCGRLLRSSSRVGGSVERNLHKNLVGAFWILF